MLSSDSNSFDIQQKLLLLTLHFPKLKIVWSPSPYASAQLFEELKVIHNVFCGDYQFILLPQNGKEEPNCQYAASIGSEQDIDIIETKYNSNIFDFVRKLPGINSKNVDGFLRNMGNMDEVINKTEVCLNLLS